MNVGEDVTVACVEPTTRVKVRDKLGVAMRPSRLHVFDAKTEASIECRRNRRPDEMSATGQFSSCEANSLKPMTSLSPAFPAPGEREGTQGQVGLCEGCPS